jgi:hypothetical protein
MTHKKELAQGTAKMIKGWHKIDKRDHKCVTPSLLNPEFDIESFLMTLTLAQMSTVRRLIGYTVSRGYSKGYWIHKEDNQ